MLANIDASKIQINTERIYLRGLKLSDFQLFKQYIILNNLDAKWNNNSEEIMYYSTLSDSIESNNTLVLIDKTSKNIIGSIIFGTLLKDKDLMSSPLLGRGLGFMLDPNSRGVGIMTEAVNAVIGFCFNTLNYDFLLCGCRENNIKSKKLIERCGFEYYAKQRDTKIVLNIKYNSNFGLQNR